MRITKEDAKITRGDIFNGDALDSVRRQAEDLYKNISPSLEFPPAHND